MGNQLGIIASSINKPDGGGVMLITTTSTSATWSPHTVTNPGSTLTWIATGGHVETIVADDPTFDLSGAGSDVDFNVSDVSQVTVLKMWVAMNLTVLDLQNLIDLVTLDIHTNQLTAINLSNSPDLVTCIIYSNTGLGTLDVSNNTLLNDLRCYSCGLTVLDVSASTVLTILNCNSNSITLAGLTLVNSIVDLNVSSNPIAGSLDLSSLTAMTNLAVTTCQLTGLTLGGGALTSITFYANASITSIDISAETSLTLMYCFSDGLTNGIDISTNTLLDSIWIQQNNFTVTATNAFLASLVSHGLSNGVLKYRNNESGQGVTDRATLITRSWTITDFAT